MNYLAYAANVVILAAYWRMTRHPGDKVWFDLANAVGCIPLIAYGIASEAWALLPLTVAFGLIGAWGAWSYGRGYRPTGRIHDYRKVKFS